jgi:DNA damage-inducible protein 1
MSILNLLVILDDTERTASIQINDNESIDLLKQYIEAEFGIKSREQSLFNGNNQSINDGISIKSAGITNNDSIILRNLSNKKPKIHSIHDIHQGISPDELMQVANENPIILQQFVEMDNELGKSLQSKDISALRFTMMKRTMNKYKNDNVKQHEMDDLQNNPEAPGNQEKLMELFKQKNIQANRDLAYEQAPESFVPVNMLYVHLVINGYPIHAFVDSGAQSTIMSVRCAERCNLMRLLDTNYAGIAKGVGTAKILGRVHLTQMKFGNSFFNIGVTVLDQNDVDFLFGLDMLRRHRCNIGVYLFIYLFIFSNTYLIFRFEKKCLIN